MNNPLVSAIIPTFNRARFLETAVESALNQTYEPIEVIVVNHGSTDDTTKIMEDFGSRILGVSIGGRGRGGVASPRNEGLRRASGKFVAFLDDDDVWHPAKIEKQVLVMKGHPSLGLVATNARIIDERANPIRDRYFDNLSLESDVVRQLAEDNFVIVSSVLASREIVEDCGMFATHPDLFMVEDYLLWLQIAARAHFALIDEALIDYRSHSGSHAKASSMKALRQRRAVLRAALREPELRSHRSTILSGLARDYARSAITILRGGR